MLENAWAAHEKFRYLAVGAWNTAFAYLVVLVLFPLLNHHLHYLIVSALAHACAVTNAFICQRVLVFRSRTPWLAAYIRFNVVQLLVLCGSLAALAGMVEVLHFPPLTSQLTVMTVSLVAGYFLNRRFSFRA